MRRKLLLLCNQGSGSNFVTHLPQVIYRYRCFFKSPYGGGWIDDEIAEMPSGLDKQNQVDWLKRQMDSFNSFDYSFIVFIGHGASCKGKDFVQLSKGGIVPLSLFFNDNNSIRRTIIVDSCRNEFSGLLELVDFQRLFSGDSESEYSYCRDLYNMSIMECKPHYELIQSTDTNNCAMVTLSGTAFSDSVFKIIQGNKESWNEKALQDKCGQLVKTVHEVFLEVNNLMSNVGQVPQYFSSQETDNSFPFFVNWKPITRFL